MSRQPGDVSSAGPQAAEIPADQPAHAAETAEPKPRDLSMARNIVGVLCPYCAAVSSDIRRCQTCGGHFDPLSRQATQNDMGPWFLLDRDHPSRPGCSYEKIRELARTGKVKAGTIIRGPTTKQFWTFASRTPSIANLVGFCHNCHSKAGADDFSCKACGAAFTPETDRQHLGLAPMHRLPGRDSPAMIAASTMGLGAATTKPEPTSASPAVAWPAASARVEPPTTIPATAPALATSPAKTAAPIAEPKPRPATPLEALEARVKASTHQASTTPTSASTPPAPTPPSIVPPATVFPGKNGAQIGMLTREEARSPIGLPWDQAFEEQTARTTRGPWGWIAAASMLLAALGAGWWFWSQSQAQNARPIDEAPARIGLNRPAKDALVAGTGPSQPSTRPEPAKAFNNSTTSDLDKASATTAKQDPPQAETLAAQIKPGPGITMDDAWATQSKPATAIRVPAAPVPASDGSSATTPAASDSSDVTKIETEPVRSPESGALTPLPGLTTSTDTTMPEAMPKVAEASPLERVLSLNPDDQVGLDSLRTWLARAHETATPGQMEPLEPGERSNPAVADRDSSGKLGKDEATSWNQALEAWASAHRLKGLAR
jgi:hypothetical protein